ncbi:MAG: DUF2490 domain-containing protein [Bacteroidota bacterium]
MISCCSKWLLGLCLLCCPLTGWTQAEDPILWQSRFTLNYKLNYDWSLNFNTTYRSTLLEDYDSPFQLTTEHLQLSHNTSYTVGFYGKVAAGVMYRFNTIKDDTNENELRFTQQYSYAKRFNAFRWVHRFKTDQRIRKSNTQYRFRYRISADFPLSGLKVDPKEFYLILSTETVFNTSARLNPAWDQRFTGNIGYQWAKQLKIQLGLEYRTEDYLRAIKRRSFINTTLFYSM